MMEVCNGALRVAPFPQSSRRRIIHIGMSEDEEREYIRTWTFVDIIGLPFTPLSFAGGARPTASSLLVRCRNCSGAVLRSVSISGLSSAALLSVLRLRSDPISASGSTSQLGQGLKTAEFAWHISSP